MGPLTETILTGDDRVLEVSNRRRQPFQGCLPTRLSGSESTEVISYQDSSVFRLWYCLGWFGPVSPPECSPIVPRFLRHPRQNRGRRPASAESVRSASSNAPHAATSRCCVVPHRSVSPVLTTLCFSQTAYAAESAPAETDRASKARGKSALPERLSVLLRRLSERSRARRIFPDLCR